MTEPVNQGEVGSKVRKSRASSAPIGPPGSIPVRVGRATYFVRPEVEETFRRLREAQGQAPEKPPSYGRVMRWFATVGAMLNIAACVAAYVRMGAVGVAIAGVMALANIGVLVWMAVRDEQ